MIFRMAERILKKVLNDEFGLDDFKYEMNDNGDLIATNNITIKGFDDDIFCRFRLTEDDLVVFSFTFDEMEKIAGFPIDHSFLAYKKELTEYGFMVGKISMKEQTVSFKRLKSKSMLSEKRWMK